LDETGYVRELRTEGTEESMSRIENLEEFDTLLQEFEEDNFHSVPEAEKEAKKKELLSIFIEQSALVTEGDKLDPFSSVVKLMTLHSSKGLEFPVVFLVGMEEGLFPSIKPWEETPDEDVEEERRLCYVGMTRAREQLYMMNVVVRRYWGNVNFQDPSRFFAELPEALVEFKDYSYGAPGASRNAQSFARTRPGYGSGAGDDYGADAGPSYTSDTFGQVKLPQNDVIGQKIEHPEYGMGTIISSEGSGHDQKVLIEFKNRQQRKFLLRYVATFIAKR
jgi:DNA helicase-2/ATP-dependent DNA helicase PcrA